MSGWQPIETAPKDGTTVILARFQHEHRNIPSLMWLMDGRWDRHFCNGFDDRGRSKEWWVHGWGFGVWSMSSPTHWMPLPESPQEGGL